MIIYSTPYDAIRFIRESSVINYNDSFNLSKYTSGLLRDKDQEKFGRDIVIRVKDCWHKLDSNTIPIWNDLVEAAGLYPYVNHENLSNSALIRYEYHKSDFIEGVYLHEEQRILSLELQSKRAVVVSAPTSFGKSLLIEEVIASKLYKQIVIIQPTLALLDETRKKLLKYRDDYKLIVSTTQSAAVDKGNIFLFTGERVVEYNEFPQIDFFVIDEFYKLSVQRDDDRAIALNQAFNRLLKFTGRFYLLGPMIQNIPVNFKNKYDITWFPTDFATVAVDELSMEITGKLKAKEKKQAKKNSLFELLSSYREQTLIYCSSPNKATALSLEFLSDLQKNGHIVELGTRRTQDMIEWISESIGSEWSLVDAISSGIAFHHGALPRHLGSSIVDAFNEGAIRWLFCTSTLIEGVNTSAKNVVLYDKEKGTKQIDFFDYKNIAGRSGRMNKHYIGNVIRFEKQPDQMELFVDIPIFDQVNAPLEILVSLDAEDINDDAKHRLDDFNNLSEDVKAVLKKNSAINIEGQLRIIGAIEADIAGYRETLLWTTYPNYEQLAAVIDLAWSYLLKPGENKADIRSSRQLAVLALKYSRFGSVTALINDTINDSYYQELYPDLQVRFDRVTFFILNVTRHWFDYKLPKWISVVSELQDFVFGKQNMSSGNYSFFATSLENGFLPPNLATLIEYDIPSSAVKKIERHLKIKNAPTENIIKGIGKLSDERLKAMNLLNYEINKLRNSF